MRSSSPPLTVLLVRHAEPLAPGTAGFDEFTRPLTEKGLRDALQLRERHASRQIDAAYSSPYLRARQTIEPIAHARGIAIDTIDDLRERMLSASELDDWRAHLRHSWQDFDYAPPGGESGRIAQARVMRVLDTIAMRHASGTVIVASHGNLIALALHAMMPEVVDYDFWESIPMPAMFTLVRDDDRWRCER
jgi:2,3-bisphosphoglycerate-dependent phosphoglycerate mutase